jgi:hypothetical protein
MGGLETADRSPATSSSIQQTEETVSGIADARPPVNGLPPVSTAAAAPEGAKETIVIKLDESGGLNVAGMREKTKTRLIEALKRSSPDLFPTGPAAPVKRFPEAAIYGAYGLLGVVEIGLASRKYPPELAQTFGYTEADIKVLMEPTQAVIARYMGVIKHEELIALGMVLAQIHIQKLYLVDRAMSQFEARKAAEKAEADKKAPGPSPEDTQERAH